MWDLSYQQLLESIFSFDFKFLCPWKDDSNNKKLRKIFRAYLVSPLVMATIMISFVYFEWETLSFTVVAENMAIALAFSRSFGYAILVWKFYREYRGQVFELLDDRKSKPMEPKELSLTEKYCRTEFILSLALHLSCFCIMSTLQALVYFYPNAYHLLFNCYMFFLPPDGFLFAWELNYLVQTVTEAFAVLSLVAYLPIIFVLMNQSCWLIEMTLITAEDINDHLQQDEDIHDPERVAKTNENLKKLTERCEKFVEWQSEVQDLLFWYFNLEFQIQSLLLCFSIYVLSSTFAGVALLELVFCTIQFLILCWMGERITSRIDQLSFEISRNWYLMTPPQRKTLQMILHWTQNMKGFSGLLSDVSLETCKAIFEASYSFYTFLKSTNGN